MDLKTLELKLGIPLLIGVGAIFHFLFEWTGYFLPTAWLFSVNEAPWEHTKLVFFPMIIYALATNSLVKDESSNLFLAKIVQYLIGVTFIVGVYYTYYTIIGEHYFPVDISLFFIGTIIGSYVSYKIRSRPPISKNLQYITAVIFVLMIILVIWWTYDPPKWLMFQDDNVFVYGPVTDPEH